MVTKRGKFILALLLLLCAAGGRKAPAAKADRPAQPGKPRPKVVRIAVPYYEDSLKTYNEYQPLFAARKIEGQPFSVNIVPGTYDDVLYWYQNEMVDLAVLPPGAVADLLTVSNPEIRDAMRDKLRRYYLGSRSLFPDPKSYQPFLELSRAAKGVRYTYKAYCVVARYKHHKDNQGNDRLEPVPIDSFSDVIKLAREKQVKFLFVHPLSVSGRILPEYLLRREGIELGADNVEWTYNHSLSLKRLSESKSGKINAAFVWDAVGLDKPAADPARPKDSQDSVGFNELKALPLSDSNPDIPQEILVSTSKFEEQYPDFGLEDLIPGLSADAKPTFKKLPDWEKDYQELIQWTTSLKEKQPGREAKSLLTTPFLDIDQIIARLRNYNKSHTSEYPLRLAVVLSGGGAKCAYQLGVIEALESKLKALQIEQHQNRETETDISLVVGTSGGAINALAVALGLTKDEKNRALLRDTWRSFSQRDFLELWPQVHVALGVSIGVLQAAFVIFVCMIRLKWRANWWSKAGALMLLLSAVNLFASWYPDLPYDLIGDYWIDHFWQHVWVIVTISIGWSAICLFVVGGTLWMVGSRMAERNDESVEEMFFNQHRRKIIVTLVAVSALSQILWLALLFRQDALSSSSALKNSVSHKIAELLVAKESVIAGGSGEGTNEIEGLSKDMMDKSLIERDLIITGSRLAGPNERRADEEIDLGTSLPNDLYFFYAKNFNGGNSEERRPSRPDEGLIPDRRFVPLQINQNRGSLLNVVIGSSSIYPLFLPEKPCISRAVTEKCQEVDLIDGGFVHNSPLEAAVKWDATHIILIEASPSEQPTQQNGLVANSLTAFDYLFSQAQNLDSRMYGQKEIYIIRPDTPKDRDEPNLDTFDFSPYLIDRAIDRGLNDALNVAKPRFHRVFAQPTY